jgi:hypothetical protein
VTEIFVGTSVTLRSFNSLELVTVGLGLNVKNYTLDREDRVSGETSVTVLRNSQRDTAWEKDVETEKESRRQRWETSKARIILGKTQGSEK